jgi:hypothetical protein
MSGPQAAMKEYVETNLSVGRLTENPFASTATLDDGNPFDDPTTATSTFHQQAPGSAIDRQAELDRRERELAQRCAACRVSLQSLKEIIPMGLQRTGPESTC